MRLGVIFAKFGATERSPKQGLSQARRGRVVKPNDNTVRRLTPSEVAYSKKAL
jgi:hypothetical protein